jgi:CubicO group peptidase (beta-lactamase class C family)
MERLDGMRGETRVFPGDDWEVSTPGEVGVDSAALERAMGVLKEITDDKRHAVTHHDGVRQSLVIRHGRMIWQGPEIDTLHTVWSCSKSFPSLCMGLLIDDRKCTLNTLAGDVVPSMRKDYPTVTLRHLANFTSGYTGRESGDTAATFEPGVPDYAPGEYFHYSQATDMLAKVLTDIAGEPLRDLFRRRIADPIGMDPAAWRWGDWGEVDGRVVCGGSGSFERGMHITARQMARVGWLLANGGNWAGRQVVSRATIAEMTRVQVAAETPPFDPEGWYVRLPGSYGVNIWLNGVTPDGNRMWPDAPAGVSAIQGNMNNICFAIPEWDMALVRLGTDGRINNDRYTEVFAALREAIGDVE